MTKYNLLDKVKSLEENSLIEQKHIKDKTKVRVLSKSTGLDLEKINVKVGDILEIEVLPGKSGAKQNDLISAHHIGKNDLFVFLPGDLALA